MGLFKKLLSSYGCYDEIVQQNLAVMPAHSACHPFPTLSYLISVSLLWNPVAALVLSVGPSLV